MEEALIKNCHLPSNLLPHYLVKSKYSTIQLYIRCCECFLFCCRFYHIEWWIKIYILARIICFMLGGICFMNFYLFIYFFLTDTNVILFVALLNSFSYGHKRLAQPWTTRIDASIDQWHSRVNTTQNVHRPTCWKRTWLKLICVEKERNSIPRSWTFTA